MQINVIFHYIGIIITMETHLFEALAKWPSGSYGLPRAARGCPEFWKEGLRYHDTEDEHSNNRHSVSYHLSGPVTEHGVRQEFCMKESSLFEDADIYWPDGQYCIYKYGDECPKGLREGWVFWDDENQEELDGGNSVRGYTPEGVYELDTLIYFCCNNKGNKSTPIELPLDNSFYLMAYNSAECQTVKGAKAISEYIQWDDEDRGNTNSHSQVIPYGVKLDPWNTKIYYCYYESGLCGKHGTVCRNTTIDETALEGEIEIQESRYHKKKINLHLIAGSGTSALAVAIGCSVAALILGTAVTGMVMRRYLNKNIQLVNSNIEGCEEEDVPFPDHIW